MERTNITNIAIIAHVDHGKTTFVDSILKQVIGSISCERVMDFNPLEKERGITILSKCTSIFWKDQKINIMDTPGHADFGGEVERILPIVDGILLFVDGVDSVQPQTQYVLRKALEKNKKIIVVVNKMDLPNVNPKHTLDEIYDLVINFPEAGLDFPVFYGSGRLGYMTSKLEDVTKTENMDELLDKIVDYLPTSQIEEETKAMVFMLDYSDHFGKLLICKIYGGNFKIGDTVRAVTSKGELVETFRINKIFEFLGMKKVEKESARAGDVVILAGAKKATVNHTIAIDKEITPIEAVEVDEPTLSVVLTVNTSPLSGKDGTKLTFSHIKERLDREMEVNVSLNIIQTGESFEIFARGELQLSILFETMRREGFELMIQSPKVLIKTIDGKKMEPCEIVYVETPIEYMNIVLDKLIKRKAVLSKTTELGNAMKLEFLVNTRLLIGYYGEFISDTKGKGIMTRKFHEYVPYVGAERVRSNGVIISMSTGVATPYALNALKDRGNFFITPGEEVYKGMIIGESNRPQNVEVNPTKEKHLTNVRASGKDEKVQLSPPKIMKIEECIAYIMGNSDESVEITPSKTRMKKGI